MKVSASPHVRIVITRAVEPNRPPCFIACKSFPSNHKFSPDTIGNQEISGEWGKGHYLTLHFSLSQSPRLPQSLYNASYPPLHVVLQRT